MEPNIEYHINPLAARIYSENSAAFDRDVQLSLRGGMLWGVSFVNCNVDAALSAPTTFNGEDGISNIRSKRKRTEDIIEQMSTPEGAFNSVVHMLAKPDTDTSEDDDRKKRKL